MHANSFFYSSFFANKLCWALNSFTVHERVITQLMQAGHSFVLPVTAHAWCCVFSTG